MIELTVDVGCTSSVVAWHQTIEDGNTVVIGGLDSTKCGSFED